MAKVGWGAFLGGIGKLLNMIPGRKERWKNELEKLTQEKNNLLLTKPDSKKATRVVWIINRVSELERLIKNSSDSE